MAVVRSLLTVVLLLLVTNQSIPFEDIETVILEEVKEYRLPSNVTPIHYDIKLIPHIVEGNFTFNGETSIDIEVHKPTNTISLHIKQLTIDETVTRLTRIDINNVNTRSNLVSKKHDYNEQTQIVTILFEELLDAGTYSLYFKYVGVIVDDVQGFYRSFYDDNKGNKMWMAATHFQPISARQAFPCWDEPAIKATFQFSIKHYPNYTALSNMPSSQSKLDKADGKVWTYFDRTPTMSTNVLGFVVADYDYISNSDGTIKIWGPKHLLPHAAYSLDIAERAMSELERFTNNTIRIPKMDHVAIRQYSTRATENWGMIVYLEDILLHDANSYTISDKVYNTMTITHELAHQWFGNLVSPAWWKYLWLSEGISNYLKFYITDKLFKEWRLMDMYVIKHELSMMQVDSYEWIKPIHLDIIGHWDIRTAYNFNTYTKSAALLRMASHFLREDVFQNGLMRYLQTHEYSNVTPDDLWKALQYALDESDVPHNDFNVKDVMDRWFEQAGYPLVTISRNYTTGETKVTQEIYQFPKFVDTNMNVKWWIPFNFATQSNLSFSSTLATHWLKPQDKSLTLKEVNINDWIIANKHLTGYYRVNYDTINWKRIAAYLNSNNYVKIPVLNRAQIINDAFYMLRSEQLDSITFLEIINYLSRETDPIPWYPAFSIIHTLSIYLQVQEGAIIFRPYIFKLMHKLFERIDFDENANDDFMTAIIRSSLDNYLCMYEHLRCEAKATAKLLAYIEDPITNGISTNQEWIYYYGLMKANESIWIQFLQTQEKTSRSHSKYLGCTNNLNIIDTHLNLIVSKDSTRSKEFYYNDIFENLLQNPSTIDTAIDFFINNSYEIITRTPRGLYTLYDIIQKCVRKDQIEKIRAFAEQRDLYITNELTAREEKLAEVHSNLLKIRSALKNNRFSVAMHFKLNNTTSQPNIIHVY